MRYRIKRLGAHSTAATVAILYFVLALLFVPIFYFASQSNSNKLPAIILILGPVCYALFGYIVTAIACWLYNLIASWTGGVAMTLEADEAVA